MGDVIIWTRSVRRGSDHGTPSTVSNTAQLWNVFDVDGKIILKGARNPFFEAARLLLGRGWDADDMLYLVPPGKKTTEHWHIRAKLGYAATRTVEETAFGPLRIRRFKPHPGAEVVR